MPNRIIKESICESEGLSECSIFARELYSRLITYADDYGRFNADTQIMLARLYPREMSCVTQEDINDALIELAGVGKIAFYTAKPRKGVYGCFPNWKSHQRVRDSKQKCPDPDDTTVNDWYLQRFIKMDLKVEIIERDGFKCQICGKFITSDKDAIRLAKHGCGMYHIDHIVPVDQGGRATLENLRLTCPACNLKRKKQYSFKEIVQFSLIDDSPQVAASCGELPQVAARIQSESESNPNSIQDGVGACAHDPPADDPELAKVMNLYLDRVNAMPSPICIDELKAFTGSLGADVCCHAINVALDDRKVSWSYIRAILQGYYRDDIKSLEDIQRREAAHQAQKERNRRPKPNQVIAGTMPSTKPIDMEKLQRICDSM